MGRGGERSEDTEQQASDLQSHPLFADFLQEGFTATEFASNALAGSTATAQVSKALQLLVLHRESMPTGSGAAFKQERAIQCLPPLLEAARNLALGKVHTNSRSTICRQKSSSLRVASESLTTGSPKRSHSDRMSCLSKQRPCETLKALSRYCGPQTSEAEEKQLRY